jgi:hypothetical protein
MTSGGITLRRFSTWAAVAFFVVAMLCAIEFGTGGDGVYRLLAALSFAFGLISVAGVWASGLPKAEEDPDRAV